MSKWLMPVVAVARPLVVPLLAGLMASQLVLAGLPAACAAEVRELVGRLFA